MSYRLGIPHEYLLPTGRPIWEGMGRDGLESEPGLTVEFLAESMEHVTPAQIDQYDSLIATAAPFRSDAFQGLERLVHIARFGVGYDAIDLAAATRAGVMVTITRGAADRPVAEGALTLMLAIGHHVVIKDRLARESRWQERFRYNGVELRDRVLGIIGFGGVGKELARLLQPFGASRLLAYDPYADAADALTRGVELVTLEKLLRESDFVSVNCLLTAETRGLIGAAELAMMKPTAFLVNTARGPIIDQDALTVALREGQIRGAALDVFREEPTSPDEPLLTLENVILAPHAIAVTDELYRDYHRSCARQAIALKRGGLPEHIVNPEVLGTPQLEARLRAIRERSA